MDWVTVGMVVALLAAGGGLVYWPMSLSNKILAAELVRVRGERDAALKANSVVKAQAELVVEAERELDAARDLAPLDELRVLLDPGADQPAPGTPEQTA